LLSGTAAKKKAIRHRATMALMLPVSHPAAHTGITASIDTRNRLTVF
jgi:hypothetical protein